jgi:hypothetical protein
VRRFRDEQPCLPAEGIAIGRFVQGARPAGLTGTMLILLIVESIPSVLNGISDDPDDTNNILYCYYVAGRHVYSTGMKSKPTMAKVPTTQLRQNSCHAFSFCCLKGVSILIFLIGGFDFTACTPGLLDFSVMFFCFWKVSESKRKLCGRELRCFLTY